MRARRIEELRQRMKDREERDDSKREKVMSAAELAAFFRAIPRGNLRDRLMFGFMYRYAMRVTEVVELAAKDVSVKDDNITIYGLKGGLTRSYPLFSDLKGLARRWKPTYFTYFHGREGPLSRQWVLELFHRYRRKAGLNEDFTPHCMRHTAAVHAADRDCTIEEIMDLLRHRDQASTMVYFSLSKYRKDRYLSRLESNRTVVRAGL